MEMVAARRQRVKAEGRHETGLASGYDPILFVGPAHDDPERVIHQRPLQRLRLVPRRTQPNIALLIGRQDHRHGFRVDRLDQRVRCGRQKAVDLMRALESTITRECATVTAVRMDERRGLI